MIKDTREEKYKPGVLPTSMAFQIVPIANAIDSVEISYPGKKAGGRERDKACKNGQNMTCLAGRTDGKDWDCFREMC